MTTDPAPPILGTLESALYADDLAAAEDFYGGVLGLKRIQRQEGRHVFFASGASMLLIFVPAATRVAAAAAIRVPVHGASGPGHYCFSVEPEALDRWRTYLPGKGIEIETEITWPNGARSIYVRDPAGNSVEFAEPGLWAR